MLRSRRFGRRERRRLPPPAPGRRAGLFAAVDELGIIVLFGVLRGAEAEVFRSAVTSPEVMAPLRVDLAGLSGADAVGLQLLVALAEEEAREGRTLRFHNPSAALAQALRSAGLGGRIAAGVELFNPSAGERPTPMRPDTSPPP